ncbi:UNVERIFIED_CONTAM: ADP-ribosylation factor GTPase-activating protein AGD1 [Sesamum calycinum]|uniref:ADP-ribosylation factor GTPase-activating protein AGD1 n=1 Tax=Sesamum calycinum TaxID=2727403 RepID=A0AAW2NFG6_9LAMI
MEESAETLRERSVKFHKGCRKYIDGLGEAYDRDIAFASALETFAGGHNDPISVAFGGPDMAKFAIALREIGTYKEILRSQDAHKRFDKASVVYDQVREKFLSLRKSARLEIATALEEELHNARSTFEQTRFNLVSALSAVEAKKRFEFLEAVGNTMDAHLRYFKQGYELLHQMEPYINQVLAYAQQARQHSNYEQSALNGRMHEYIRQVDQENRRSFSRDHGSQSGDSAKPFPRSSNKLIEAVMHSSTEGKVQTIKQGYLSKRSSNLRGDWKRRFFVLDSRGMLYYYRKQWSRPTFHGSGQIPSHRNASSEQGSGLLSRWLSSHYHGGVHDEKSVARHTVNLLTSTIKVDAEQSDLRFCFRIISPTKNYTLQAESAADQMDWIEKITGVITSLLSSQAPERQFCFSPVSENSSFGSPDCNLRTIHEYNPSDKDHTSRNIMRVSRSSLQLQCNLNNEKPIDALKKLPGNDKCADCGAPEPDWASLNLGFLYASNALAFIGILVRSLTLDVKAWEPSVIALFQALGNVFVNSVWEGVLRASRTAQADEIPIRTFESDKLKQFFSKPHHNDHISVKEKFIHAKDSQHLLSVAEQLWESVRINDKKAVYRILVMWEADVNAVHGQASPVASLTLANVMRLHEKANPDENFHGMDVSTSKSLGSQEDDENPFVDEIYNGCSLLHLACQTADIGMVELLLQHGANINFRDARGYTPLHHSIIRGRTGIAKLLVARGASPEAADNEGRTPFQLLAESAIDDVELLALMKHANR